MTRYKPTKKTLIIAAMIVLLCLLSITGATLALFTSSIEDGTIGINATTGDLEADIIDTSPTNPESLVGDVLNFYTTPEREVIYFEPGATYRTEGFRVKNTGEIPFQYILYISHDSDYNAEFADAFEVWLTNDLSNKASAVKLQDFDGRLNPGHTSETYYLVFRMKESAGNEFQNKTFSGIGITVCAIQGNAHIK